MMLSDREGFRKLSHWSVSKMNVKELNHVSVTVGVSLFLQNAVVSEGINETANANASPILLQICFHYPPCPLIFLVAYTLYSPSSFAVATSCYQRNLWWYEGRPSLQTEPGVSWHLAFHRKNYASVLTFSLMHKIHDVCGTSCRRCSRERDDEEHVTAGARTHTTSSLPHTRHTHTAYVQ